MLVVHRSERADRLVEALGDILAEPLDDPVQADVVSVPTRGVERWLTQRLSHRLGVSVAGGDGVCANIEFPFPGSLVASVLTAVTGHDPAADPWVPERAVWPLIEVIDEHLEDPALSRLAGHLRASSPAGESGGGPPRRFAMARHLADLFDRYGVHRPSMLQAWAAGDLAGPTGGRKTGGEGMAGPTGEMAVRAGAAGDGTEEWQAYLWRLLRQRIGVASPAERLAGAVAAVAREPAAVSLPRRVSVFGLTRLPASYLDVLAAVAGARDVHLFLLHPSARLWERTARSAGERPVVARRRDDFSTVAARHPLLRAWGRDAREMQLVLAGRGFGGGEWHPVGEPSAPTLLQRVQADIRADRFPARSIELDAEDTSLQVHACHGRARQVEVMRDAILHLLADDPTLEPRDVIVMCPDIDVFAPLIHAAFGAGAASEADGSKGRGLPPLRVRLADRSLRQTNPLLGVASQLMELAGSRVTATQVLDLASLPAVAKRFGFDQDDLSDLEAWVAGSGVRWGLDARHRASWALGELEANTWASGLDRLALGVAMEDRSSRSFGGVVPFEEVGGSGVELAGRLAELVHRLRRAVDRLGAAKPAAGWASALLEATESLAVSPTDEWQHDQLHQVLGGVGEESGPAGPDLTLDEAKSLLASRLGGQPTRANFRTGDLTVCTLVPMRSVPHRVVALLGLDDGSFPRPVEVDGDDLLLADPHVGDRDARSEDRQLLLDAVLAATEHLLITYSGRDDRTNRPLPPCAPVADLLDVVDATACCGDGRPARERVLVQHPLQPFDRRNFLPAGRGRDRPWSFDRVFLAGARSVESQVPVGPWLEEDLPPLDEPVVQLDHLVAFVKQPVRAFLRRRLSWYLGRWESGVDDGVPVDVDGLTRWGIGDRLLQAYMAGEDLDRATEAEMARGVLPPSALGTKVLDELRTGVDAVAAGITRAGFGPGGSRAIDVQVELADGRRVIGTVPLRGDSILQCSFSRLSAKHRLEAWLRFLAATADRPEMDLSAVSIGRGQRPGTVAMKKIAFPAAGPEARKAKAQAQLARLVALYDQGMLRPLPLAAATSEEWATAEFHKADRSDRFSRARLKWEGTFGVPGEADEPEHLAIYRGRLDLRGLLEEAPTPEERSRFPKEPSRFEALTHWLWKPLLQFETAVE